MYNFPKQSKNYQYSGMANPVIYFMPGDQNWAKLNDLKLPLQFSLLVKISLLYVQINKLDLFCGSDYITYSLALI